MTTNKKSESVDLMRLAKTQASDIEALLRHPALAEDTGFCKEVHGASHSVIDCLSEAMNEGRPEQFQKNFLVIAKAFNAELRTVLLDCFDKKYFSAEENASLLEVNKQLESGIVSSIQHLQKGRHHNSQKTTLATSKK